MKATIRKFLFYRFENQLDYHAYEHAPVAGFAGYYRLFGFTIAFDVQDERVRYPHFRW